MTASLAVSRQILQSKSLVFEDDSSSISAGAPLGVSLSDAIRLQIWTATLSISLTALLSSSEQGLEKDVIRDNQSECARAKDVASREQPVV